MKWEDYLIEGTDVLKNKFNITDNEKLYKKETEIVLERLGALILYDVIGDLDIERLKNIHRYLFNPIYEFAGQFREVDIYKKPPLFSSYQEIEKELEELLIKYNNTIIDENNTFAIAKFLSDLYYDLIIIHPFREGNGRSIREFIREYTSFRFPNLILNYEKVNKQNFLLGILDHDNYPLLIAYEIYNALETKKVKTI